jgi:hypothetical protein
MFSYSDYLYAGSASYTSGRLLTSMSCLYRISELYERIDLDESNSIDIDEFNNFLHKLALPGHIMYLSAEDFEQITEAGRHCIPGQSSTPNPKLPTPNPKPQTPHPRPQTPNPKP